MTDTRLRLDAGAPFASEPEFSPDPKICTYLGWEATSPSSEHTANAKHFIGGNSSCCMHLCQHYQLYKSKCENADILINHWAIPRDIWKVMKEEKTAKKQGQCTKKQQQQLLCFETITGPHKFTRSAVLNAVTKLIVINNEVSHYQFVTYANSKLICSCLCWLIIPHSETPWSRWGWNRWIWTFPAPMMLKYTSITNLSNIWSH